MNEHVGNEQSLPSNLQLLASLKNKNESVISTNANRNYISSEFGEKSVVIIRQN